MVGTCDRAQEQNHDLGDLIDATTEAMEELRSELARLKRRLESGSDGE